MSGDEADRSLRRFHKFGLGAEELLRALSATPDLSRVSDRGTLMVTLPGPRMSVSAQVRMRGVR